VVVLPDHIHAVWRLPAGDANFPGRWRRIKQRVTLAMRAELRSAGSAWQPRYWEHLIRDDEDLQRHVDYIHYNPVKHGLVQAPRDWPHSSFHRFVAQGLLAAGWGGPAESLDLPE
jgi:putative transposase